MAGIKNAKVTELFNGQSDIVVFDEVEDYNSATFATVTASGESLGQIVEDSTTWDGDEPSLDSIKDEQGDVVVINPTSGTYAFSCDLASTATALMKTFLKATEVTDATSTTFEDVKELLKFGTELPVITRPIAVINDEANRVILFPKAKIIGSLSLDSKLWRIHLSATAEYLDTKTLGTCMTWKGKPKYDDGSEA